MLGASHEYDHKEDHEGGVNKLYGKETFKGVSEMLKLDPKNTQSRPIIFIIKNIKQFNPSVLNDLIHLLRKYRSEQTQNFCLVLGV